MPTRYSARKRRTSGVAAATEDQDEPSESVMYDLADAYRIMKSRFLADGFASSQTESFDDFVNVKIPQSLSEHPPVVVVHDESDTEHVVEILGVRFDRPSVRESNGQHRYVTPHECHIRRISYSFLMLITARYTIRQRSTGKVQHSVIFRDKPFDRLPAMKFSEFCTSRSDPESLVEDVSECGGYFISTGAEKVVIGQEGPRTNYPFITRESDGTYKCECRSFNEIKFRSTSTLYVTLTPPHETGTLAERRACVPRITVHIPFVSDPLPLPVTFKLLGVTDTEAMVDFIAAPSDPQWFRERVLGVILYNIDAVVMSQEYAVTRLAHDRGQSYTVSSSTRKRRQEETQATKRRRKRETETEFERCSKQVSGLISTEFLPHQGYSADCVDAKAVLFGGYVRKLLQVYYELQKVDSRDDYQHRRVSLTSTLMTLLFRKHFTMWRRRLASQIRRDLENGAQYVAVKDLLRANIGNHLQTALSTGDFSMHRGASNTMDGVGQVLSRTEPHAAVSHVCRTSNPMNKDGRAITPRLQHPSCLGVVCPWETPEGGSCGLMRNKAAMAGIRVGYSFDVLASAVLSTGMVDVEGKATPIGLLTSCQVYVSGTLIGTCSAEDPEELLALLRARRSVQDLPYDVSIYRTRGQWANTPFGEIHVNGDSGSYWWPLLRVDKLKELRSVLDHISSEDQLYTTLLGSGIVEIINKDEEATAVRCALDMTQLRSSPPGSYTHVVIHPSQICSVFSARAPGLEFNQAPRVTYAAAMEKQALGRPMTNAKYRADTASHTLWYPQRALVSTFMDETLSGDGICSVQNPTVCILCNGGYNVEDSLIFDRGAIERGLFRSTVTRTVRDVVRKGDAEYEELGIPPPECRSKLACDYSKVNPETGCVDPNITVGLGDVLISKFAHQIRRHKVVDPETGEQTEHEEDTIRDRSSTIKSREDAVVDDVIFSTTLEGEECLRVKTRAMRVPEVGDKFASRYGQKGTIGAVYDTADMPCSHETGLVPDIVMNPHAIPSRMTIGHVIETLLGKVAALSGMQADATPFTMSEAYQAEADDDKLIKDLGERLAQYGFTPTGTETMIDGRTGQKMEMKVFVGPMSYQKLKHMVKDKWHARSRGPKQVQTMQPVEGRHRDGGQRFGEMEKDALVSHGATELLQERLLFSSDKANVPVCTACGQIAHPPKRDDGKLLKRVSVHANKPFCPYCLSHDTVVNLQMPYAYKTSVQELQALHLASTFSFEDKVV